MGRLRRDTRGVTLVEYALVLALFGLVMIGALNAIGREANSNYNKSSQAFQTLQESPP